MTPPEGVDEAAVRKYLLTEHDIEIGGGLGPLAGKLWRIGLMGYGSSQSNVLAVLSAIEQGMKQAGQGGRSGHRRVRRAARVRHRMSQAP